MARKKKPEEHENHERWLISYADFITLLFAFFVVMYSISSVNQGKYRVLSESLVASFKNPQRSISPIQVGHPAKTAKSLTQIVRRNRANVRPIITPHAVPMMGGDDEMGKDGKLAGGQKIGHGESFGEGEGEGQKEGKGLSTINQVAEEIKQAMAHLMDQGLVSMVQKDEWIEVEIKNSVLFASGSAKLQTDAVPLLEEIARILRDFPSKMKVEGFTDNVPINTLVYPSNWELSAARASSVVRLFEKNQITPDRMMAIGYGEHRPIGDNSTAEGRAQNRRVVLVVMADTATEQGLSDRINKENEKGAGLLFGRKQEERTNVSDDDSARTLPDGRTDNKPVSTTIEDQDKSSLPIEETAKDQQPVEENIKSPVIPLTDSPDEVKNNTESVNIVNEKSLEEIQPAVDLLKRNATTGQTIIDERPAIRPELPPLTLPEEEQAGKIELPITLPSQMFLPPIKFSPGTSLGTVSNINDRKISNFEINDSLILSEPESVNAVSPEIRTDIIDEDQDSQLPIADGITQELKDVQNNKIMNKDNIEVTQKPGLEAPVPTLELKSVNKLPGDEHSMQQPSEGPLGPLFSPPIQFKSPLKVPQMGINNGVKATEDGQQ